MPIVHAAWATCDKIKITILIVWKLYTAVGVFLNWGISNLWHCWHPTRLIMCIFISMLYSYMIYSWVYSVCCILYYFIVSQPKEVFLYYCSLFVLIFFNCYWHCLHPTRLIMCISNMLYNYMIYSWVYSVCCIVYYFIDGQPKEVFLCYFFFICIYFFSTVTLTIRSGEFALFQVKTSWPFQLLGLQNDCSWLRECFCPAVIFWSTKQASVPSGPLITPVSKWRVL